jgi:ribosome biogenesis protein UTP30
MEVDDDSTKTKKGTKKSGLKRASGSDEEEEEEKPRKKSKGAKGIPVDVPPTPKEKSISKSTIPPPVAAPSSAKITKAAAAHVDTPAKSKKRMAAATPSMPEIKDATSQTTTADVLSAKKAKKMKPDSVSAAEPLPSVEPPVKIAPTFEPIFVAGDKKKKKRVPATINVEPSPSSAEVIPKKKEKKFNPSLESPTTPSVPIASEEKPMRKRKKAKSDQANPAPAKATEIAAVSAVTKEEHKQKYSGGAGQKKKEKVAKMKGGKSAKDALLGKKAGQSL